MVYSTNNTFLIDRANGNEFEYQTEILMDFIYCLRTSKYCARRIREKFSNMNTRSKYDPMTVV